MYKQKWFGRSLCFLFFRLNSFSNQIVGVEKKLKTDFRSAGERLIRRRVYRKTNRGRQVEKMALSREIMQKYAKRYWRPHSI